MPVINWEVSLFLTLSSTCVIINSTGKRKFTINNTKLYVPAVTLSTQDNAKLLQQLKSGFKRTINWNKYESNIKTFAQNRYLNHLINPSFQGVNRLFVLSFENENDRTSHSTYYLPKVEIKDYNVMIDGKNVFINQQIAILRHMKILEKLILVKEMTTQPTGRFLDYSYFKGYYKMIAIDLSKQQVLDADPRAIQQINFTANLDRAGNTRFYFILEEAKETVFEFSQGTVKVL